MGRARTTDARRDQIVSAMIRLMASQGYEGASIKEIAQSAQLAPGLVHYHFASKPQILGAVLSRLDAQARQRMDAFRGAATGPRARLDALILALVSPGPAPDGTPVEPEAVAAWTSAALQVPRVPELRERWAEIAASWRAILQEELTATLRAQGRSTAGAAELATALLAAIHGCFLLASAMPTPAGFAAPNLLAMVDGLLAAQPPAQGASCD